MIKTRSLRVVLVRCPVDDTIRFHSGLVECLGIASLTSSLRARRLPEPVIIDAELDDLDVQEVYSAIQRENPDVVAFTVPFHSLPCNMVALIRRLRLNGYARWLVIGGHSPTFYAENALRILPELDAVFISEADSSFPRFIENIMQDLCAEPFSGVHGVVFYDNGHIKIQNGCRETPLDLLPPPSRDLTRRLVANGGLPALSTSRGCSYSCNFCSVHRFYSPLDAYGHPASAWQAKSAQKVITEIRDVVLNQECRHLLIVDEEFFGGGAGFQRAADIAAELSRKPLNFDFSISCRTSSIDRSMLSKLKAVGLSHVFLGIESGASADLDFFSKHASPECNRRAVEIVHDLGLSSQLGTIILHPWSTFSAIRQTYSFLRSFGCHGLTTQTTAWIPYYGSIMTERLITHGWSVADENLAIQINYQQSWHQILAKLFDELQICFLPFYRAITNCYQSHTYLWRDKIRAYPPGSAQALANFEDQLNDSIADLLDGALEFLEESAASALTSDEMWSSLSQSVNALHILVLTRAASIHHILAPQSSAPPLSGKEKQGGSMDIRSNMV